MKKTLLEILSEDLRSSKEKAKSDLARYERDLDRYRSAAKITYNKFSNFAIGDLLEPSSYPEFKRLIEAVEKMENKVEHDTSSMTELASDMFDEYQDDHDRDAYSMYKDIKKVEDQYHDLVKGLEIIHDLGDKITDQIDTFIEKNKLRHLKDFQEGLK